jgi:hypothetical protein
LLTYPLEQEKKRKIGNTINPIVEKHQYNTNLKFSGNISYEKKRRERSVEQIKTVIHHPALHQSKLVNFAFYVKEVQHFTKLFKNTHVWIAPKNNSTLEKVLAYKTNES